MFGTHNSSQRISAAGLLAIAALLSSLAANADDGAASIAAGGLVARLETRVVMAKEVLRIGTKKIVVDYDFRNDSNDPVTTEVAFPVPPYQNNTESGPGVGVESFSDFRLTIDGKTVTFQREAKALLKGKDVTELLTADKIDIASFGHFVQTATGTDTVRDLNRLPRTEQQRLESLGLVARDPMGYNAKWMVQLQYHWTQIFPPHSTVHIRHEYTPVLGFSFLFQKEITAQLDWMSKGGNLPKSLQEIPQEKRLASFCADRPFMRALESGIQQEVQALPDPKNADNATLGRRWVDFILTTANTWKQPIEDFTLIIERPKPDEGSQTLLSFCSVGKVSKLDADHFQMHLTNFVPKDELHIGFFSVPTPDSTNSSQ
jgi:hypothetical protein